MDGRDDNGPVPEMVQQFVVYLYRHIREKNVGYIQHIYNISFSKITDMFYSQKPWPRAERISYLVDDDHVFCLLYKELFYRHLYATSSKLTLGDQLASWENYCQIFGIVLLSNVNMHLPVMWLYDMIDEFVSQYQYFCNYRDKLSARSPQEIERLKSLDDAWSTSSVLNYLEALIEKSGIDGILKDEFDGKTDEISNSEVSTGRKSNVLTILGYYSIIGLMRVHCLVGDYVNAIIATEPARLAQKGALTTIPTLHVETYYYLGFSYMMCHRYCDALRSFSVLCGYINRQQQALQKSSKFDKIMKKMEAVYALLAICLSLCPMHHLVEEAILSQLRDKHGEKMIKMNRMDEKVFDEMFEIGCPKFVSSSQPDWTDLVNKQQDAYRSELKLFMQEIRLHVGYYMIRSQLSAYSSISLLKLSKILNMDERMLRNLLTSYKQRTYALQWSGEVSSLAGKLRPCTDIDFNIENDTIHVIEHKEKNSSTDFFKRSISMLEEATKNIQLAPAM